VLVMPGVAVAVAVDVDSQRVVRARMIGVRATSTDDDLEVEDDDDLREDVAALLGIPVVDVDVDGEDADDIHTPMQSSKKSDVWSYFDEVKDGEGPTAVCIEAICKHCSAKYSAIPANGTTHLRRHMKKCMKLKNHSDMVRAKIALNANGLANWKYGPMVARIELCRLIARLDLPLGTGETRAWSDYIRMLTTLCLKVFLGRPRLEIWLNYMRNNVQCF
jgi:hypothetical protein